MLTTDEHGRSLWSERAPQLLTWWIACDIEDKLVATSPFGPVGVIAVDDVVGTEP